MNVHESVLSRKLVFWTSTPVIENVIKYDFYVKFPQMFAHNLQICAKFCCKTFTDVCQVFRILHRYTQGDRFCGHAVYLTRTVNPFLQMLQHALLPSVKHILTDCSSHNQTQQQYCIHTNLRDIFDHSLVKNILDFIKNVSLLLI